MRLGGDSSPVMVDEAQDGDKIKDPFQHTCTIRPPTFGYFDKVERMLSPSSTTEAFCTAKGRLTQRVIIKLHASPHTSLTLAGMKSTN